MGNSAKRDARSAERHERMREALQLRKQLLTYPQIAKSLGVSLGGAYNLVHDAIAEIPREDAKDVLAMELERLDQQELRVTRLAETAPDDDTRIRAELALLKVRERRAKYLGLDAPAKSEVSGPGGGPLKVVDVTKLTDEQLQRLARGLPAVAPGDGGAGDPAPPAPED